MQGDKPIEAFLNTLSNEARAKCLAYISRLETDGTQLPASIAAHVRGKTWELRLISFQHERKSPALADR